jgi:hypothetical protein
MSSRLSPPGYDPIVADAAQIEANVTGALDFFSKPPRHARLLTGKRTKPFGFLSFALRNELKDGDSLLPDAGLDETALAHVLDTKVGAGKNDDARGDGQGFESRLKSEGGRRLDAKTSSQWLSQSRRGETPRLPSCSAWL